MLEPDSKQPASPSRAYLAYALAVIFAANFLNYLDRTVVSGLEKEITVHLGASKTDYGWLWTAFTVGYMLTAPVIGFLADRVRRSRLFAGCVLIWSLATIGCGMSENYWFFLAMRVIIGVGEAGCLVIGPTLVADYFSRRSRGRVLSILFLGTPLGGALGYYTAGQAHWPNAFFVAGLPGLPIALLLFFLRDPQRGGSEPDFDAHPHGAVPNLQSLLMLLKTRTLLYIILAQALAAFTLVPLMHFGIGFFEDHGVAKEVVTRRLGRIVVIGGVIGTFLGGLMGDWMRKRDAGAYAKLAGICFLLGFPLTIAALHSVPDRHSYWLLFGSFTLFFMCMPLVNTQIANVVHPTQRAAAYAAAVFILHILGDTISPPLFGLVSSLPKSMDLPINGPLLAFTLFPCSLLFSSLFCFLAWRAAPSEVQTRPAMESPTIMPVERVDK